MATLTHEQWLRTEALFLRLLELPAAECAAALRHARTEDAAVADEAGAMLAGLDVGDDFLRQPVQVTSTEAAPEGVPAGTRYGPWRVLGLLGRGGMGEVYAAERADGAYQQQVALKILKRGLDTDAVLERFLRERRILAQLTHPNIAHLIDAGATPDGRPYLVMEKVDGLQITHWCRQRQLPLRGVLMLMCEVCEAVHAAHRRLVVHRDLKPSNVLVTADGMPKLLDFGIAKLLGEPQDQTLADGPGSTPLTPQYAAPEQIMGQPVTTAADVYSLGALLYELLTTRLPRDHSSLAAATVALSRGDEPLTRPSALLRDEAASLAPSLGIQARDIEGDLDLIVLKCLHSDPERRYRSASELADDLKNFLAQRPILARPDSLAYRSGRFLRRNRVAVGAAAAALLLLLGGVAAVAWEARQAELQALRAEHVKDLILSVFRQQDPLAAHEGNPRSPTQLIAASLIRADQQLRGEPDLHAELLDNLGEIQFNIGDATAAAATLRRALAEKETYYGANSLEVARTLCKLTRPLSVLALNQEERRSAKRAVALLQGLHLEQTADMARAELRLGIALSWGNGAPDQALALQRDAVRIFQAVLGPDDPETINALWEQASTDEQGRRDAEAEQLLRETIARYEKLYGSGSATLEQPLSVLARVLERNGRTAEAETMLQQAITISLPLLGPRHHTLATNYLSLGVLYAEKLGRFNEAEQAFSNGEATRPLEDEHAHASLLKETGRLHLRMGKNVEAERELGEAFVLSRKILGDDKGITWYTGSEWGRSLAANGRLAEAEAIQREAAQKLAALMGQDAYQNCLIAEALADTLEKKGGALAEVLSLRRRALELTEQKYPKTNPLWAERAYDLARGLMAQGGSAQRKQARGLLDQAAADYLAASTPMDKAGQTLLLRAELEAGDGEREAESADLQQALLKLQQQAVADAPALARAQALLHGLGST